MKKRILLLLLILFINFGLVDAALGISPAKIELNYLPGKSYEFDYVVSGDGEREIDLYTEGDLAKYVELDKDYLVGGGGFRVSLKLPRGIEDPGWHIILIGAKEKPLENEFLGASINIRAVIKVFVPYPGKYIDAKLNIQNGNINSLIPVEVHVINRGERNITTFVNVDILENDNIINTLIFNSLLIEPTKERYFRKHLNTTGMKPGKYSAIATIDYGEKHEIVEEFRVGHLFVNITDYSKKLNLGSINKFNVDIESNWNNDLKEVSADINLSNGEKSLQVRTPSDSLKAWEKKRLVGFIDTESEELEIGTYDLLIKLNYGGIISEITGEVEVVKRALMAYILIGAGFIVVIISGTIYYWLVWRKRK